MIISKRVNRKQLQKERSKKIRAGLATICIAVSLFYATGANTMIPHINIHMPHTKAHAEEPKIISPLSTFYLPLTGLLSSPVPTKVEVPQPTTAEDIDRWERVKHAIRNISQYYHISPKVGIAQAALESARGTSYYCVTRNNCFGIGAYDWDPDQAYTFNSIEEGVIEYYRLQRNNFPEAWAAKDDPAQMIRLLENNSSGLMYATDPDYVYKLENLPEWGEN